MKKRIVKPEPKTAKKKVASKKPASKKPEPVKLAHKATPLFVKFYTGGDVGYLDVFLQKTHCGRWLEAILHEPARGWLAFVHAAVGGQKAKPEEKAAAVAAWKADEPLPDNFVALTPHGAEIAFNKGVEMAGIGFFDKPGVTTRAIQFAVLGEVRYAT